MTPYLSNPANVECRGWTQVGDAWLSTEPLYDTDTNLHARLSYAGALEACSLLGAALPEQEDIQRLHDDAGKGLALELTPVTLPDQAQMTAAGVNGRDQTAVERFLVANMAGLEWAHYHDDRVREQLQSLQWDGQTRLANCGKHWIAGAPKGRAYLMGWWLKSMNRFIQAGTKTGPGPHDDGHHDYGTLTLVVRTTAPDT